MPRSSKHAIIIGRAVGEVDILITNTVVSSFHAKIYIDTKRQVVIEDLGSANGTYVLDNKSIQRVPPKSNAPLYPGTFVKLGHRVTFEVTEEILRKIFNPRDQVEPIELKEAEVKHIGNHPIHLYRPAPTSASSPERINVSPVPRSSTPSGVAGSRPFIVGRGHDVDVFIDQPVVSRRHAEIILLTDGDGIEIRDLGGANGTYLNQPGNRITHARAHAEESIFFGSYRVPVRQLLQELRANANVDGPITLPIEGKVTVGRKGRGADIQIDAPQISGKHAEISVSATGITIRDLNSSNGTWVNNLRISAPTAVRPEDKVSLGSYAILLEPGKAVAPKSYAGKLTLSCEDLEFEVSGKKLLHDMSLTIYPTEFVGLLGPSGAGKTTLLQALNGYAKPSAGKVYINGADLYQNYEHYRGEIGYVPQEDIVYPSLTVYQSLWYTAKLRLPADTTNAEIDTRINTLLDQLAIANTRDVRIGDALRKGISGGQRKRVNLAQELLTNPYLLFLDEPTSGLASGDTLQVMKLLRELADEGRTIILTIHQPSSEAYREMDQVIYLHNGGHLVYFGPTQESISFFNPDLQGDTSNIDPGEAMKPLALDLQQPDDNARNDAILARAHAYEQSGQYHTYVQKRRLEPLKTNSEDHVVRESRPSLGHQAMLLTRRNFRIKWSDSSNTAILLAQAPIIAVLLILVFKNNLAATATYFDGLKSINPMLFLLVASSVWFGCNNAAREIVSEQAIYRRERMVNLRIDSYVLSKLLSLGILSAVQCTVFLAICWAGLAFEGSFIRILITLMLCSAVGTGIGLLLSALVRSQSAAVALVPIVLIPQIILGGLIIPHVEQSKVVRALSAFTITRWGFESLLNIERQHETTSTMLTECSAGACRPVVSGGQCSYQNHEAQPCMPNGENVNAPLCMQFCDSIQRGRALTPIDQVFGPDINDPNRQALNATDQITSTRSGTSTERSALQGWLVLLIMTFIYTILVNLVLRYKDPRPMTEMSS